MARSYERSSVKSQVYCYGCGQDITENADNRYNMHDPQCKEALPIWKKFVSERFERLNIDVDLDLLLLDQDEKCIGRMCFGPS